MNNGILFKVNVSMVYIVEPFTETENSLTLLTMILIYIYYYYIIIIIFLYNTGSICIMYIIRIYSTVVLLLIIIYYYLKLLYC